MSVLIGERLLATRHGPDLDDTLVAATGCTAVEHAAMLERNAIPFQVARVLSPMLVGDDVMPVAELADLITQADPLAVRLQVVDLLRTAPVIVDPQDEQ